MISGGILVDLRPIVSPARSGGMIAILAIGSGDPLGRLAIFREPPMQIIPLLLTLAGLGALVWLAWRLISRRHALPCPVWLRWLVELDNPLAKVTRAASIVEHLDLQPGMTVLDLGCGPGRVTLPLARAVGSGGSVVAVDIQSGMLERARSRAQTAGLANIAFVLAGAGEGKLGTDRFDRAVLVTVLGEIVDREGALREVAAALKPGGILSVTEMIFDPHYQRRETLLRLATAAGLREAAFFGNRIAYTIHLEKPSKSI